MNTTNMFYIFIGRYLLAENLSSNITFNDSLVVFVKGNTGDKGAYYKLSTYLDIVVMLIYS